LRKLNFKNFIDSKRKKERNIIKFPFPFSFFTFIKVLYFLKDANFISFFFFIDVVFNCQPVNEGKERKENENEMKRKKSVFQKIKSL